MDGAPARGTQAAPTSPPWGAIGLAAGRGPRGTWSPGAGSQGPGEGRKERGPEADGGAPSSGSGTRCPGAGRGVRGSAARSGAAGRVCGQPLGRGLSLDGAGRGRSRGHARPSGRLRPRQPRALRSARGVAAASAPRRSAHHRAAPPPAPAGRDGARGAFRSPQRPVPADAAPPGPSVLHAATPTSVGDGLERRMGGGAAGTSPAL